jgi:hypothetical protein
VRGVSSATHDPDKPHCTHQKHSEISYHNITSRLPLFGQPTPYKEFSATPVSLCAAADAANAKLAAI